MIDWTEWGPPLVVMLAAGLGGGALATTMGRDKKASDAIGARGRVEDLQRQHDVVLEALAALEMQQDAMDPADYQAERRALLEKGAHAMRELDKERGAAGGTSGGGTGGGGKPGKPGDDRLSKGIAELTAALKRGEIDEVTFATAVAALSDAQSKGSVDALADGGKPAPAQYSAAPPKPARAPAVAPQWQGAIYAIAGLALVGGLVYYASNQSVPRRDGAPMSGNQSLGGGETPPAGQPQPGGEPPWVTQQRATALAALEANPKDVKALNTMTQLALNEPAKAWNYNEQAREADPNDLDAQMLNGVITAIMGMPDKAHEKFDAVLAKSPDHAATWAWQGLTYAEEKNWPKAAEALQKAKDLGLSDHTIDNTLAIAKNGGEAPAGMGASGGPPPGPAPASAGSTATIASGVVSIDPNRETFKATTLFVNIKDPTNPGPPIAAKKLPPGPYPLTFSITEADKIGMGGPMGNRPIPDTVQLSLRLDEDGNAFTKGPDDPEIVLDVTKGTTGLELTLK
ncbi:MAG: hypothetical protein R3F61_34630 [Myxococcota bacterium]